MQWYAMRDATRWLCDAMGPDAGVDRAQILLARCRRGIRRNSGPMSGPSSRAKVDKALGAFLEELLRRCGSGCGSEDEAGGAEA